MNVKNGICSYTLGSGQSRAVDLRDKAAVKSAIFELKQLNQPSLITGILDAFEAELRKPSSSGKISDLRKSIDDLRELSTKEIAVSKDAFKMPPPPPIGLVAPKRDWRAERALEQQRLFGLGLSLEFTSALKEYISSGYRLINSTLRMEDKYFNPHDVLAANGPDAIYARIDLLVKSLLRQPGYSIDRGYLLRGWPCDDTRFQTRFVKYKHFVDNAFLSTGAGNSPFSPKSGKTFILKKILLPGAGGHSGKKVPEASVGAFAGEDEVLFPPGAQFVVREARLARSEDNDLVDASLHGKFKYYTELVPLRIDYNEQNFRESRWYTESWSWLRRKYTLV